MSHGGHRRFWLPSRWRCAGPVAGLLSRCPCSVISRITPASIWLRGCGHRIGTFGPGINVRRDRWFGCGHPADADRPARLAAVMTTPALPGPSLSGGTGPVTGRARVPPLRSDLAERGRRDAGQGAASEATWAIFQELRPQFAGLPPGVVQDYVDQAVRDLLGSICVEALPEMAIRLAAVRLEHRLRPTDGPPGGVPSARPSAAHQPPGASRNAMTTPAPPFAVIHPPAPRYPPSAMTAPRPGQPHGPAPSDRARSACSGPTSW
jgi:hypothetical protein